MSRQIKHSTNRSTRENGAKSLPTSTGTSSFAFILPMLLTMFTDVNDGVATLGLPVVKNSFKRTTYIGFRDAT